MEEGITQCNGETSDTASRVSSEETVRDGRSRQPRWTNGQCVLAVPTSSILAPSFDLSLCRILFEREGFQIPVEDFETPVGIALDPPSIRRYLFFNSSLFHFFLAPVLYIVLWCAVYSSLHQYLAKSSYNFWVLCLCVSLASICITTAIMLLLHYNNNEINVNTDVRLVSVNERLIRHGLLLGVADWVQQCSGKMQLFCVFWDMSPCLRALTETLEGLDFVRGEIENKLKKRMSHLFVVTEVPNTEADDCELSEEPDEEQPLLVEARPRSISQRQIEDSKLTRSHSLIPDCTRSYEAIAYQLLLTYSAVYVRLMVSERLPASSHRPLGMDRNHCTTAPLCLCQYIQHKLLR
ncbi:transmembrane protein 268 isoform X2 [Salminus brasiliensis]|uniref:transmembrane protein 268 isoform X2 n=1 Tax=Salminus brasiliensis TaxID=930266 RepID=UPI003B830505